MVQIQKVGVGVHTGRNHIQIFHMNFKKIYIFNFNRIIDEEVDDTNPNGGGVLWINGVHTGRKYIQIFHVDFYKIQRLHFDGI